MKNILFIIIISLLISILISCSSSKEKASATITDKNWMLKELNGTPVPVTGTKQPFIILHKKESRVNGNAGCNNFFGSYQINGVQITISNVGATKMACQDMELENNFFQLLQSPLTFSINGDELIFKNNNGNVSAIFEKANK